MTAQSRPAYSTRSRRCELQENDIRTQIKKIEGQIQIAERRASERDADVKRQRAAVFASPEPESMLEYNLAENIREREAQLAVIKSYEQMLGEKAEQIRGLTLGATEATARLEQQKQLAQLADRRLEQDRQADRLLKELREVLSERGNLSCEMAKVAGQLELMTPADGFDNSRFEKLLASLPADLLKESERWHGWFLGSAKDAKPYVVRVEHLPVLENLAHNGIYHFGEMIFLTEEEVRDLLREDYAAGTHEAPWRCEPPKVMTSESCDAALAVAREKGISLLDVCFRADVERDAREKEWYRRNGARRTANRRAIAPENNIVFQNTAKVRVRVTGNLGSGPGTLYDKGEIIEMPLTKAWEYVNGGPVEPL